MPIKSYLSLTKPGIIFGNMVTAVAGFALASQGQFHSGLLIETLLGLSLIIASACVINNYQDRAVDEKMMRTKNRPLVTGAVPVRSALCFAVLLAALGMATLLFYTSFLTLAIALFGYLVYIVPYKFWKYRSYYGTVVGSLAGGVPPAVGYCAVCNRLDLAAGLIFLAVVLWQMPHFFAIAMYRIEDYAAAGLPVLPLVKGAGVTKVQMLVYICAFLCVEILLTLFGYTGYAFLGVASALGIIWIWLSLQGFRKNSDDKLWARKMFFYSLISITCLSATISFENF